MDPFTLLIQRTENESKFQDICLALQECQLKNPERNQIVADILKRINETAQSQLPENQRIIDTFKFTVPQYSLGDIAAKPKYRPMLDGKHFKVEKNRKFYNRAIETSEWADENLVAATAREQAALQDPIPQPQELEDIYRRALFVQIRRNAAAYAIPPDWILLQNEDQNDIRAEDSWLQYLDSTHKKINWFATIQTIQSEGSWLGYTTRHYKRVLERFVSYFNSELAPLARIMPVDNLAKLLMSSTIPAPARELTLDAIHKLTRKPGEDLRVPMSRLYTLATSYYQQENLENYEPQVYNIVMTGLQHFTSGETKSNLIKIIKRNQLLRTKLDYHGTLEACIDAEKLYGQPMELLQYGQSAETIMVFHSMHDHMSLLDTAPSFIDVPTDFSQNHTDEKYGSNLSKIVHQPTIDSAQTKILEPTAVHGTHTKSKQNSESTSQASSRASSTDTSQASSYASSIATSQASSHASSAASSRRHSETDIEYAKQATSRSKSSPLHTAPREHQDRCKRLHIERSNKYARDNLWKRDHSYSPSRKKSRSSYRSPSRDRNNSSYRSYYQDRQSKPYSDRHQSLYSRSQSPYYRRNSDRNRSLSPYRRKNTDKLNDCSNENRQWTPYRRNYLRRSASPIHNRQSAVIAVPGINCSPNYREGENFCRKCMTDGHGEPYCKKFYIWTPMKCSACKSGYHMDMDCAEHHSKNS